METKKAIASRYSVRAYKKDQIAEEKLETILAAGSAAPVGMGRYDSLHVTVIQDEEIRKRISEGIRQIFNTESDALYGGPTLVLVSSKEEVPAPGIDYTNAACVAENMMLAGADIGIGSVLVWGIALAVEADKSLKEALSIPEGFKAMIGTVFGYAANAEQKEKDLKVKIQMNRI